MAVSTRDFSETQDVQDIEAVLSLGDHHATATSTSTRFDKSGANLSPILKRRMTRSNTIKNLNTSQEARPHWDATAQEPGLDTSLPNGGRAQAPTLAEECQITVVDFSEEVMVMHDFFTNKPFLEFLEKKQEDWVQCRWINVNGFHWDIIQALGSHKKLHRLAIEDLVNTDNRTKADWYTDHTFIVLTLQKLVHLHPEIDNDSDSADDASSSEKTRRGFSLRAKKPSSAKVKKNKDHQRRVRVVANTPELSERVHGHADGDVEAPMQKLRTLQRYHGGPNKERIAYMERHSPLTAKNWAVSAEQVSIFLTADNTVISFFESSADDVELPILHRLSTPDTLLRKSCDASMITQAIIDAIIDLAIPVATAYQDVIGDLELDVLTNPSLEQSKTLYLITSEITKMRSLVSPIANLIDALRDHKTSNKYGPLLGVRSTSESNPLAINISPMAQTYLGDVYDHCMQITETLDQMRRSCDGMIGLIFNTISAYQNEVAKQLTNVSIIFLPLTFLTGYFGMNIVHFPAIDHDETYFWFIAVPLVLATIAFLMRDLLKWWVLRIVQRRQISRSRRSRRASDKRGRWGNLIDNCI